MSTLSIIAQMIAIIVGLLAVVGALFYGLAWMALMLVQFVPMIGKRHRHTRWDEFNSRSGRK